jgi:hypothetical protein
MANDTAGAPWGATVDAWTRFQALGLESDLLPVVSNPKAQISEHSKMRDLGKTPSRYHNGKVVGIPKWTQFTATENDIKRWARESDYGICIQTRTVRALDIDIADPAAAALVRSLIELGCGVLPMRRRADTGKCLLAFRMPGEFAKRVIHTEHGLIEFLANGQQFIAVGAHFKSNPNEWSGTRYEWVDHATGEIGLPQEIPELTPAEFEVVWQELVTQFALPGGESRVRNGMVPTKPRLAGDLRDPTVAWLDENGWVTGYERDGRVDVRCPWEHEHTSDSGPSSTSYFPAGVGGFDQGHFRCLHAHCASRTDGDFLEAVGLVASEFEVLPALADAKGEEVQPMPAFTRDGKGAILPEINNVLMALRRPELAGCDIAVDEFKGVLMYGEGGAWRPLNDNDYLRVQAQLERRSFKPLRLEMVKGAVRLIGEEHTIDSAQLWAATLRWDGVPRIDTFWSDYYGVAPSEYHRAVGAYTWTALAGRCVEPGCKADMVPVLIGIQGTGKTSAIEAMSPIDEAFVEIDLTRKDDDIARSLRGKLVGEIAELRGLQGRDAESIKAWVSRRIEEWTPKYREFTTRFHRRFLAFGTGNNKGFLDDDTGERRWLPLEVGTVDLAGVRAVRDQLWAEGIVRFRANGVEWQDAQRLAAQVHAEFKVVDPWLEAIREWLERDDMDGGRRADGCVRVLDVLVSCIGLSLREITRKDELRVGKVLPMLGYQKGNKRIGGVQAKVWTRAENSTIAEGAEKSLFSDLA